MTLDGGSIGGQVGLTGGGQWAGGIPHFNVYAKMPLSMLVIVQVNKLTLINCNNVYLIIHFTHYVHTCISAQRIYTYSVFITLPRKRSPFDLSKCPLMGFL